MNRQLGNTRYDFCLCCYCTGVGYLSQYGWHIVLVVVCLGIVWMKLGPTVREWWAKRKQREEELNFGEFTTSLNLELSRGYSTHSENTLTPLLDNALSI